jgi:hypothetical protein
MATIAIFENIKAIGGSRNCFIGEGAKLWKLRFVLFECIISITLHLKLLYRNDFSNDYLVADLDGAKGVRPLIVIRNLASDVSKVQD